MSANMYAVYEARVRKFDKVTKIATVVMPGVYGMEPFEAPPFTTRGMDPSMTESLVVGDRVLVVQGENEVPEWLSVNPDWYRAEEHFVKKPGDTMTGPLLFNDPTYGPVGSVGMDPATYMMKLASTLATDIVLNAGAGGLVYLNGGNTAGPSVDFNSMDIPTTHVLNFGAATRQMLNLYNTTYGIGVQTSTTYLRSASEFRFYKSGTHSNTQGDAGGGAQRLTIRDDGVIEGFIRMQGVMRPQTGAGVWGYGSAYLAFYDETGTVVGTPDPDTLGTRTGYVGMSGTISPAANHLYLQNETGVDTRIKSGSGAIVFTATATEIARMTTTEVLVGKTASAIASEGCELYGSTVGAMWVTRISSNGSNIVSNKSGATANLDGAIHMEIMSGGTQIGRIVRSTSTAAAFIGSSDKDLKENIVPVDDELALLWMKSVEPVFFNWKDTPDVVTTGYVAQDVAEAWDGAVTNGVVSPGHGDVNDRTWDEDGNETTPREVWQPWGMDYGRMTPFLHAAMQAMMRQIEALQEEVALLRSAPGDEGR